MPKALVLLTNGKYKEVSLKGYKDYQKEVDGNIELMPVSKGYVNPDKPSTQKTKRSVLTCYANEVGMMNADMPINPWGAFLSALGITGFQECLIWGNVIVMGINKFGDDGDVDPYIVKLAEEYSECEDEDEFIVKLEKLNR